MGAASISSIAIPVELGFEDMLRAASIGVRRRCDALRKKRRGTHGFDRDYEAWSIDVEAAGAEMAAAKALGVEYNPAVDMLDKELGDIGPGLQVRSTKYGTGHLLVHNEDADEDKFILVTGQIPNFTVVGWAYGHEGKKPEYWRCHRGRCAYWTPQEALRSMQTLG